MNNVLRHPNGLVALALVLGLTACAGPMYGSAETTSATTPGKTDAGAKPVPKAGAKAAAATKHPKATAALSSASHRHDGYVKPVDDAQDTPAYRYGQMEKSTCEAELGVRQIAWKPVDEAPGVAYPVRLEGPLHGVTFHSAIPSAQRATSPYEIMDCRLVVALDDFAALLAQHDIVEVVHMSAYRPPGRGWPDGKLATRHPGALALDVGTLVKRDGTTLVVERDFHGHIGAKTCGDGAGPVPSSPVALELRSILCDATDKHLFTVALTPNYNYPHRNHFHLEITPEVTWNLVH